MSNATRKRLEKARERDLRAQEAVEAAQERAADVRAELLDAIRDAQEEGVSLAQVGDIFGVSKQRVFQLLKRDA